jgi:hypothetical protein
MSTRVISSPGVQINEIDQSLVVRTAGGTNIFMTGFASQGPTDEIVNVGSVSEYESIFGAPSNEAERYLYHSARQVLTQSRGNLLVTRMPYGSGQGAGFANSYSALVYPVSTASNVSYTDATSYVLLEPKSILLDDTQYQKILSNDVAWLSAYDANATFANASDIKNAGLIVLNPSKVSVNSLYEGYYVGVADNSNNNPATDFDCVSGVKAASVINGGSQTFKNIPASRLNFTLTQSANSAGSSISQIIEQYPTSFDFGSDVYKDCLTLMVFKIRTSIYAQDTVVLDYKVEEGYTGSLYANKTQNNPSGGAPLSFSLEKVANLNSNDIKVVVNPYISSTGTWIDEAGVVKKTVRVANSAKNLYSQGVFVSDTDQIGNDLGNVPNKLQRVLTKLDDLDVDLDITAEAGLGTIWTAAAAKRTALASVLNPSTDQGYYFDETYPIASTALDLLKSQNGETASSSTLRLNYNSIISQFHTFAEKTRRDHIFIADPLRHVFVNGPDSKVVKNVGYNFSTDIYWPLKNLYSGIVSSYGATYGNWIKYNDVASNQLTWLPASGYIAADIAYSSEISFPWSAPAGFNRGLLTNIADIAINPTQKQRDLLYRININPIAYFPGDGYAIFGQKTLFNKPSAFDRINVRRLFLVLEKATTRLLRYFVFEPNTFTTRTRLVNALVPLFNQAKNNDGLYDYKLICDERNNTPDVIDNNELKIAIYIQPVRTAEFILSDFIATRTGVNFNEITA